MAASSKYIDCKQEKGETASIIEEMNTNVDMHNQRVRAYNERKRMGQQEEFDNR